MPENETNIATPNPYAPTVWGSKAKGEDLLCPSGQTCRVLKSGPQQLVAAGVLESMDALTGIVQNELIPQAEGRPKVDAAKLAKNPAALTKMLDMADKVVVHSVLEPKVHPTPGPDEERDESKIYTDMIDIEDKFFIMQFAMGGVKDFEQFRKESETAVVGMDELQSGRHSA